MILYPRVNLVNLRLIFALGLHSSKPRRVALNLLQTFKEGRLCNV
ncbi:Uncharacterised protein [Vibrio cholerae]|nr:Uncharacterised protein [Vibrio cholerae]CSD16331.1 Uncharacterised protein [Vibrio cholerae]